MSAEALKPCPNPWCKLSRPDWFNTTILGGRFKIVCVTCNTAGPSSISRTGAAILWNTRATDAETERLRGEAKAVYDELFRKCAQAKIAFSTVSQSVELAEYLGSTLISYQRQSNDRDVRDQQREELGMKLLAERDRLAERVRVLEERNGQLTREIDRIGFFFAGDEKHHHISERAIRILNGAATGDGPPALTEGGAR